MSPENQIKTCTNTECDRKTLQRIPGNYALTKVALENNKAVFNPSSGIPVACYVCPKCGEIRNYSAKILKEI